MRPVLIRNGYAVEKTCAARSPRLLFTYGGGMTIVAGDTLAHLRAEAGRRGLTIQELWAVLVGRGGGANPAAVGKELSGLVLEVGVLLP